VEEILGSDRVEEIKVRNLQTHKISNLPTEGIFIYVGSQANTAFLAGQVKLDQEVYILTDENLKTSVPGIFAAGDVRHKSLKQIVTAAADGALAADSARRYIEEELIAGKK